MVVVIVGRELLVTALRSFLEESAAAIFPRNLSGKLKMLLQCVAAGSALVYLHCAKTTAQVSDYAVPGWIYWFTVASIWLAMILTVYSGAVYVWIAWKILKRRTGRAITNVKDQDHRYLLAAFVALVAARAGVWYWLFKRWRASP